MTLASREQISPEQANPADQTVKLSYPFQYK